MFKKEVLKKLSVAAATGLASVSVFAQTAGADIATEAATFKSQSMSNIEAVGGAFIAAAALAVLYKWAKATFFGG